MSFNLKQVLMSAGFSIVASVVIIFNIIIIILITRRKQLQCIRFYILVNLSVVDTITLVFAIIGFITRFVTGAENFNLIRVTFGVSAFFNSLLTTAFLAIDRYIAVRYSLRYETMLTNRRMFFILAFIWLLSSLTTGLQWIDVPTDTDFWRRLFIILPVLCIPLSTLLLGLSRYTNNIRKSYIKEIEKRRIYFGIESEKRDILRALKNSLKDSFKFYISTIIIILVIAIMSIIEVAQCQYYIKIKLFLILSHHMVNLNNVALTQREIKFQFRQILRSWCHAKTVHNENAI